jgi:cytochrome c-type biogenesis protein
MTSPLLSVGLAFGAGVVTVLSPCVLPVLPIIIGRSLQSHRYGPMALVAGLVGGFAVAGSLLGFAASWIPDVADGLRSIAILILLVIGLLCIFPQWGDQFFRYFSINFSIPTRLGLVGEFWLGTQLGLLWTPCAGSVLASILLLAAVQHQPFSAFRMLLIYGLGAAIPLLILAYGGRYWGRRLLQLRSYSGKIHRIGGIIIVSTAIAILLGIDVWLQLWIASLFSPLPI